MIKGKRKRTPVAQRTSSSPPYLTKLMNFNIIPFRYSEETFYIPSLLLWCLTNLLGSTNPERNALLQEPLSTSVENYNCSQFSNCYYHQDLHQWSFQFDSHQIFVNFFTFSIAPFYLKICFLFQFSVWYKLFFLSRRQENSFALAPWIFRALSLGWWAITHSLADSCFHGHSPTVYETKRLLWYLD